jgi:hypothetical protein
MLKTVLVALLLSGVACGAVPALAQPASSGAVQAPPAEMQAKLAAARELVEASKATDMMKQLLPLLWRQLVSPLVGMNDPKGKAAAETIAPMMIEEMQGELTAFGAMIAKVYADNYTLEEMKALTEFMRSPIGQKFIQKQPQVAQASMLAGQQFGRALAERMRPRIEEALTKQGIK